MGVEDLCVDASCHVEVQTGSIVGPWAAVADESVSIRNRAEEALGLIGEAVLGPVARAVHPPDRP